MTRLSCLAFVLAAIPMSWHESAAASEPAKKPYLLFPIHSELQRRFLFDANERYYLMVYGESLVDADGKIDPSGLDFDELSGHVISLNPGEDAIRAEMIWAKPAAPRRANRLLCIAFSGWAHDNGFKDQHPGTTVGDEDWKTALELTADARGLYKEEKDENAVGDDTVKVYPVRTALSRLRTSGADCVVWFLQPRDKNAPDKFDDKTKAKVKELVASLKLKELKEMQLAIRLKNPSKESVHRFDDKTARDLADHLGVKKYSVAWRNE